MAKTRVTAATFECNKCKERTTLKYTEKDKTVKVPEKCLRCGAKDFELVSRKLEDNTIKRYTELDLENIHNAGMRDGEIKEAQQSLQRRFTEAELSGLMLAFWLSDFMQSIRNDLSEIKKRLDVLEKKDVKL